MFNHALVLGKFYPPHAGHHRLARAGRDEPRSRCSARRPSPSRWADRVRWLAEEHVADDGVAIIGDVDDHPIDYHDDTIWALHVGVVRSVLSRRAILDGDPSGEHRREWMTARFEELLADRGVPWVKLTGSRDERLADAVAVCDDLLVRHFQFSDPLTA